tara:strand:+ start:426 stop:668 length:243 start_codon:yes stop_codon:yes gene_type:complete
MSRLLAYLPLAAAIFAGALAWGGEAQKNADQNRRLNAVEVRQAEIQRDVAMIASKTSAMLARQEIILTTLRRIESQTASR